MAAKRFQDRDKPGITALYGLVPVLIASLLQAFGLTGTPQEPNALGWICTLITMGVGPVVPDRAWHPQGHARAQSLRRRSLGCRAVVSTSTYGLAGLPARAIVMMPNDRARRQGRSARAKPDPLRKRDAGRCRRARCADPGAEARRASPSGASISRTRTRRRSTISTPASAKGRRISASPAMSTSCRRARPSCGATRPSPRRSPAACSTAAAPPT